MTGLEIGGLVTIVTVGAAIFGLQVWKCSQNSQAEESKDALSFDLDECSVDGSKITIKGLHIKANEADKARIKESRTEGDIGNKDVSLAALNTIGHQGGVLSLMPSSSAAAPGLEGGVATPRASTVDASVNNAQGVGSAPHILSNNGPQGTHIVQTKADMVDALANALIQFVSQYVSSNLDVSSAHQGQGGLDVPLLSHNAAGISLAGENHAGDLETGCNNG